jgi:uncharacterized protein
MPLAKSGDYAFVQHMIKSFVLREGTEYGAKDFTLPQKVAHVIAQLERGVAQVIFEPQSQSDDIVMVAPGSRT